MTKIAAALHEVTGPGKWTWKENIQLEMVVPEQRINHPGGVVERGRSKVYFGPGAQILEIPLDALRRALGERPETGRETDEPRIFH